MKIFYLFAIFVLILASNAQYFTNKDEINGFVDAYVAKVWKIIYARVVSVIFKSKQLLAMDLEDIFEFDGLDRKFKPAYKAIEPCDDIQTDTEEDLKSELKACLIEYYLLYPRPKSHTKILPKELIPDENKPKEILSEFQELEPPEEIEGSGLSLKFFIFWGVLFGLLIAFSRTGKARVMTRRMSKYMRSEFNN